MHQDEMISFHESYTTCDFKPMHFRTVMNESSTIEGSKVYYDLNLQVKVAGNGTEKKTRKKYSRP
jgi:hypothetical protein